MAADAELNTGDGGMQDVGDRHDRPDESAVAAPTLVTPPPWHYSPPSARDFSDLRAEKRKPSTRKPSRFETFGWLLSGIVHLAWAMCLTFLLSPFGAGNRTSITLEVSMSESPAALEMLTLPPIIQESPVVPMSDESSEFEPITIPEPELPTEPPETEDAPVAVDAVAESEAVGDASASENENTEQLGKFFGTEARGDSFAYVVDISSSMRSSAGAGGKTKLKTAADEVMKSVENLTEDQQFFVTLFSSETRHQFNTKVPRMVRASTENKRRLRAWINNIPYTSGTDPRYALRTALRLEPGAVFMLTDGEFNGQSSSRNQDLLNGNPSVEAVIAKNRKGNIPIHSIVLEAYSAQKRMRELAKNSGGTYRFIDFSQPNTLLSRALPTLSNEQLTDELVASMRRRSSLRRQTGATEKEEALANDALLKALRALLRKVDGTEEAQLRAIVKKYPKTDAAKRANAILKKQFKKKTPFLAPPSPRRTRPVAPAEDIFSNTGFRT